MWNERLVTVRKFLFLGFCGGLVLTGMEWGRAAEVPAYGDMRGTYRGVGSIVIRKAGRPQRLAAPVKVVVRLSRNRQVLQISTSGNYLRNNRREQITSAYALAGKGRATYRQRDRLTNNSVRGNGTTNLRRLSGKFTMRANGYGLQGILSGRIKVNGNSMRIRQTLRDGEQSVTFSYLLNRRNNRR